MYRLLYGPESIWLLLLLITQVAVRYNHAYQGKLDDIFSQMWWIVPALELIIFMSFNYIECKVILLPWRLWISGLIFGHFIMDNTVASISVQNPGTGTIYILGMIGVVISLIIASVIFK